MPINTISFGMEGIYCCSKPNGYTFTAAIPMFCNTYHYLSVSVQSGIERLERGVREKKKDLGGGARER